MTLRLQKTGTGGQSNASARRRVTKHLAVRGAGGRSGEQGTLAAAISATLPRSLFARALNQPAAGRDQGRLGCWDVRGGTSIGSISADNRRTIAGRPRKTTLSSDAKSTR